MIKKEGPIQLEEIIYALELLGGEAQAKDIKDKVTELRGGMPSHYSKSHSYRETIQKKIEDHCPQSANYKRSNKAYFQKVRRGVYRLIHNQTNKKIELEYENIFDEVKSLEHTYTNLNETTQKAIIEARVGQGIFREQLINLWKGCCVTGFDYIPILVASHIKPWKYSNNEERLDKFNGFLLLPNLDKLFDLGLITFDFSGNIIISDKIKNYEALGLSKNMNIKIREENKKYLEYHQNNIFQ